MLVEAQMGSVTRAARSVGGDAGSSVAVEPQGPPHMVVYRNEWQCALLASSEFQNARFAPNMMTFEWADRSLWVRSWTISPLPSRILPPLMKLSGA